MKPKWNKQPNTYDGLGVGTERLVIFVLTIKFVAFLLQLEGGRLAFCLVEHFRVGQALGLFRVNLLGLGRGSSGSSSGRMSSTFTTTTNGLVVVVVANASSPRR